MMAVGGKKHQEFLPGDRKYYGGRRHPTQVQNMYSWGRRFSPPWIARDPFKKRLRHYLVWVLVLVLVGVWVGMGVGIGNGVGIGYYWCLPLSRRGLEASREPPLIMISRMPPRALSRASTSCHEPEKGRCARRKRRREAYEK